MRHHMPPSKTQWPSLNVVIFAPMLRLILDDTKQWPPRKNIDQIHELILEYPRISDKSIPEQPGISREWVGSIIHEDLDMRKLSAKWVRKCLNADQKSLCTVPVVRATFRIFSARSKQWGGCRLYPKKSRQELFQRIFALGIFWGGVRHYATTPLIVALSPSHSDTTRFHPWSPIVIGNHWRVCWINSEFVHCSLFPSWSG